MENDIDKLLRIVRQIASGDCTDCPVFVINRSCSKDKNCLKAIEFLIGTRN